VWWTVLVSTVGGALTTLLGVMAGGLLSRRAQERHWMRDAKATAYAAVVREYTRAEFDLRMAFHRRAAPKVDWAQWGGAVAALSLVADDEVVAAASAMGDAFVDLESFVLSGRQDTARWGRLLESLVDAQMRFVNTARRSLDRAQPELHVRLGGPLLPDQSPPESATQA